MKLQNYSITFTPLSKAPAGTFCLTFDLQAVSERVAISLAEAELDKSGSPRAYFKKSVDVALVRDNLETDEPVAYVPVVQDPPAASDAPVVQDEPVVDDHKPESALVREVRILNEKINSLDPGEVLASINVSNEAYHAAEGLSCSQLKLFMECPAKYKAKFIDKIMPPVNSDTFSLGTAVHTIALEPWLFNKTVIRLDPEIKVRRGAKWEAFQAANPGKLILPGANYDLVKMANDAIQAHPYAGEMLRGGMPEVSIFKRDVETGLIIKCRPDFLIDGDLIIDVKTAASSEPKKFGMDAKKMGYHIQDAMYRDISGIPEFAFLVIESKAPCVVTAPVMMDDEVRRLGYLQYRDALQRLVHAYENDDFPNYTNEPVIVGLSAWERTQLEKLEAKRVA